MTHPPGNLLSSRVIIVVATFLLVFGFVMVFQTTHAATNTFTARVTASSDDARVPENGHFTSQESWSLIGAGDGNNPNVAGFRFTNVTIPPRSTITGVTFAMTKRTTSYSDMVVDCDFEATDNAATFSTSSTPAQRAVTGLRVHIDGNVSRVAGKSSVVCNGSRLAAALQAVINRPGWHSGNAIALLAMGPADPAYARTDFLMSESGATVAPRLIINFSLPGSGTPTSTPTATNTPTATSTPGGPTPVAGQPCPAWVHDQYVAKGPDGKMYATWHPPMDPKYGCYFGHEHGDDPTGSPALHGHPVLFGYAAAQAGMTEPHVGYKVYRWDNISSTNAPNHDGASYLTVLHQGTSGAGRFTTVYHSIEVHYVNPHDGREIHVDMLAPFGKLLVGCGANDPQMDLSIVQQNVPGIRQVASERCFGSFNAPGSTPNTIPYEDWITALYVGSDGRGNWRAYMDPHYAVFNPNTYCVIQNGACTVGFSDVRANTGADPASTGSWFKGDHRESYLNQVWLANAGQSPTFWTDPYGRLVSAGTAGAIQQYVAAMNLLPTGNSSAFGSNFNHDPGGTVHAPN